MFLLPLPEWLQVTPDFRRSGLLLRAIKRLHPETPLCLYNAAKKRFVLKNLHPLNEELLSILWEHVHGKALFPARRDSLQKFSRMILEPKTFLVRL